jgi:hypothetical protein
VSHPLQEEVKMPKMSKIQSLAMMRSNTRNADIGPAYSNWTQALSAESDKAKLVMLQSQFDDFTKDYKDLDAGVQYRAAINA